MNLLNLCDNRTINDIRFHSSVFFVSSMEELWKGNTFALQIIIWSIESHASDGFSFSLTLKLGLTWWFHSERLNFILDEKRLDIKCKPERNTGRGLNLSLGEKTGKVINLSQNGKKRRDILSLSLAGNKATGS